MNPRLRSFAAVLMCSVLLTWVNVTAADESKDSAKAVAVRSAAVFRPVTDQAPVNNAGLFVGVNEFTEDDSLSPLRFAVHDAIEQAYLFVVQLNLISPTRCLLAVSGTPSADAVREHLEELRKRGVHVIPATETSLLKSITQVSGIAANESDVLVVGISSHGFDDGTVPYVMPSDGLRNFLDRTAIRLRDIENTMQKSRAGHRLLLVDACQERVSVGQEKGVRLRETAGMSVAFSDALKAGTGQAKLTSCSEGEFSYEYPDLRGCGHGVFTSALLDALEGGAAADDQGLIRVGAVADSVHQNVTAWIARQNRERPTDTPLKRQSPAWFGPRSAESLPLAMKAGDLESLIISVRKLPLNREFDSELRDALVERLEMYVADFEADREVLAATREYVDGKLTGGVFFPFLREASQQRFVTNSLGMKLRRVGNIYLGITEVTQGQWKSVMSTEPWRDQRFEASGADFPATYVSWNDADEFCRRLSVSEKRSYRLPREAEWLAAYSDTRTHSGIPPDTTLDITDRAWIRDNVIAAGKTSPQQVGSKPANSKGVFDMAGNVWEWCVTAEDSSSPEQQPYRGGSFMFPASATDPNHRVLDSVQLKSSDIGFRVVLELCP